ncbi:GPI12 [Candida oxycetoniae]|uniref:N-acetylglucosaminylphosphatidylinositol deacetylase n=1 Tax=Candida oxycetoniae TaxID=497107 RepID=A0AAI9T1T1_9ASCO|nr:GPI12 [Candida oxycetoniae]KAI3406824.2 GPI12 [Candida oxycetoniae]
MTFPKNLNKVTNSTVYFIIGHPDDEVMFFAPTILELSKSWYGNDVELISFSKGDAVHESMARIRSQELYNSARMLGVDRSKVHILSYKDGMNETWSFDSVAKSLGKIIDLDKKTKKGIVLITFDESGVSSHPNHISLYYGTKEFFKTLPPKSKQVTKLFTLKSLGFWEKYSFTLLTNIELFVNYISILIRKFAPVNINVSFFSPVNNSTSIKIYSDLNMLACSYAAMAYGHFSQMVWFRYGWLALSRYLTYNHLIEI